MDVETKSHAMYLSGSIKAVTKINHVPYQTVEYDDKGMFQVKLMDDTQVQIFIGNEATPSILLLNIYNTQYCKSIQKLKVTLLFIPEEV